LLCCVQCFPLPMALALLLPCLLFIDFPTFLSYLSSFTSRETTSILGGDQKSSKIWFWFGGFKFPFSRYVLGQCLVVSYVLYPLFPEHHVCFSITFMLPLFLYISLSWSLDCCLKVISILLWDHIVLLYHTNILGFISF
jgi:hypothetical protein